MKTMRSAIVTTGFRSNFVQIGNRKYEVEKLTKSSRRRLLAVLESVPDKDRCVELHSDLTPVAYFYFYKLAPMPHLPGGDLGMFPAAHRRPLTREQKQAARTAELAKLECARAKFAARIERERLAGKIEWTAADQLEAESLLLVGRGTHPTRENEMYHHPGTRLGYGGADAK